MSDFRESGRVVETGRGFLGWDLLWFVSKCTVFVVLPCRG